MIMTFLPHGLIVYTLRFQPLLEEPVLRQIVGG